VRFLAQHESLGDNIGFDGEAGEGYYFWLELSSLLVYGRYEWAITIVPDGTNDSYCEENSSFIIEEGNQVFPTPTL